MGVHRGQPRPGAEHGRRPRRGLPRAHGVQRPARQGLPADRQGTLDERKGAGHVRLEARGGDRALPDDRREAVLRRDRRPRRRHRCPRGTLRLAWRPVPRARERPRLCRQDQGRPARLPGEDRLPGAQDALRHPLRAEGLGRGLGHPAVRRAAVLPPRGRPGHLPRRRT